MERLLLDLSINVTRDVPRPVVLPRAAGEGGAAAADLPVLAALGRGLLDRRGGLLARDPARRGRLTERVRIYATDINEAVLEQAKLGVFPLEKMQEYTQNYIRAGGTRSFSEYYVARYDGARFARELVDGVVFAQHNLVSDAAFNEFNVITCRNVMIYFAQPLQERVHDLFYESLGMFGVLALGQKETIRFSPHEGSYEELNGEERLYRKIGELRRDRDRRVLGRATGSGNVARREFRRSSTRRSSSRSTARLSGTRRPRVAAAAALPPGLRAGRQGDDRAPPRLRGARGLPPARRRRPLRTLGRRARPVRPPVDRRPLRVGRRVARPRDRDRAHGSQRGRRRRPRLDQAARRRLDRPGSAHGGAPDDAGRRARGRRGRRRAPAGGDRTTSSTGCAACDESGQAASSTTGPRTCSRSRRSSSRSTPSSSGPRRAKRRCGGCCTTSSPRSSSTSRCRGWTGSRPPS